jgi:hypothetical protein
MQGGNMENLMVIRVEVIAPENPLDLKITPLKISPMLIPLFASVPK